MSTITEYEWWTVTELAARWRCSDETVRRRIAAGDLKAMRGVGGYRVHLDAIRDFEQPAKPKRSARSHRPAMPLIHDELGLYGAKEPTKARR